MQQQASWSANRPITSRNNKTGSSLKYIPGQNWPFEILLQLIAVNLEIDCANCIAIAYPPLPGRFCFVTLMADGTGNAKEYTLECVGEKLFLNQNTLGDILANLAFGGTEAVNLYISSPECVGRKLTPSKQKEVLIVIRPLFDTQ